MLRCDEQVDDLNEAGGERIGADRKPSIFLLRRRRSRVASLRWLQPEALSLSETGSPLPKAIALNRQVLWGRAQNDLLLMIQQF